MLGCESKQVLLAKETERVYVVYLGNANSSLIYNQSFMHYTFREVCVEAEYVNMVPFLHC